MRRSYRGAISEKTRRRSRASPRSGGSSERLAPLGVDGRIAIELDRLTEGRKRALVKLFCANTFPHEPGDVE